MATTKINPNQTNDYVLSNSIFRQALINPNCEINQLITAVNLTSGKLFGPVDMFYAKGTGTAVSAGTITQSTSANVGNSGYALLLSGVTLTGTGKTHVYTFIESLNAKLYKNKTASFSVKVYHNVGSAINYVIKINKANSTDNFSAVTNIATANAQSVPNTTETLIKFENVSLGDCSNGIEIEVEASCGAVTTKNFQYTDWQFNEGNVVLPFCSENFGKELEKSMRYIELSYDYGTAPGSSASNGVILTSQNVAATTNSFIMSSHSFMVQKMKAPVVTPYDSSGNSNKCNRWTVGSSGPTDNPNQSIAIEAPTFKNFRFFSNATQTAAGLSFQFMANACPTIA